jgi:hypothetical protein
MHQVFTIGLLGPGRREPHRLYDEPEARDGTLHLGGPLVAMPRKLQPTRIV